MLDDQVSPEDLYRDRLMSGVIFKQAVKRFKNIIALKSLDHWIEEDKFLTLLGSSGCGNTIG